MEIQSDTFMPIEVFADKPGRGMIDGNPKYHSWESIITLERLIRSGMPQQYMVSATEPLFFLFLISRCLTIVPLAWAHFILYGEEATKQAQKEGEEAAAAYEKEKKDIAEGKIPAVAPKVEKKKQGLKKNADGKVEEEGLGASKKGRKRGRAAKDDAGGEKKRRTSTDKESLAPILAKGAGKVRYGAVVCIAITFLQPNFVFRRLF